MKGVSLNQKGTALLGVIVTLLIIAALIYGGSFFWPKKEHSTGTDISDKNLNTPADLVGTLDQAKDDIADIQEAIDQRTNEIQETASGNGDIRIAGIKSGDTVYSPVTIEGTARANSGSLIVEIQNTAKKALVQEEVKIKAEPGKEGPFKINLNFQFNNTKEGFIVLYDDGQAASRVEIPVKYGDKNDWQAYRYDEQGFEFMLPAGYTANDLSDGNNPFRYSYTNKNRGNLIVVLKKQAFDIEKVANYRGTRIYEDQISSITVAGKQAYEYSYSYRDTKWTIVEIPLDQQTLTLSFEDQITVKKQRIADIKDEILTTLNFID